MTTITVEPVSFCCYLFINLPLQHILEESFDVIGHFCNGELLCKLFDQIILHISSSY